MRLAEMASPLSTCPCPAFLMITTAWLGSDSNHIGYKYGETPPLNTVEPATELTLAGLSNPNTRATPDEVPAFLHKMHDFGVGPLPGPAMTKRVA